MSIFYEHREERLFIGEITHFPFPLHVHELAELITVTAGSVQVTIDGIRYTLEPGDTAIVFPMIAHSYDMISPDLRGQVAIFPPDIIPEYSATFHSLVPEYPVLRAEKGVPDTRYALARLEKMTMEKDLPLCVAYLHVLLAATLHNLSYHPVYELGEMAPGDRIMRYVAEHACEEITLESAAHALGLSPSHLSHFFGDTLHINFRRFINANRISKARLLMRDPNMTLTMISDACGYANMRTFRRAFQREVGLLPSDFMQELHHKI